MNFTVVFQTDCKYTHFFSSSKFFGNFFKKFQPHDVFSLYITPPAGPCDGDLTKTERMTIFGNIWKQKQLHTI